MLADSGRDLLTRTLGPIAARFPNLNPNVVTGLGFFVSILGGVAFALTDRHPAFFLVAALLGVLYGFLDALDGVLARLHGKTTMWGDFLDHSLDRLSALVALGGLTLTAHLNDVLGLLLMLGTLYQGFLGTQLSASFGSRVYAGVGIAEGVAFALLYGITAFTFHALGQPFYYIDPLYGYRLSVTDTFALCGLPLIVIGTVQRFAIARALARELEGPGSAAAAPGRAEALPLPSGRGSG